jgi:gamma-glutamyltranspeptidase
VPDATVAALRARGPHVVGNVTGYARARFGRGHVIRRDPGGRLVGASDPRADGDVRGT